MKKKIVLIGVFFSLCACSVFAVQNVTLNYEDDRKMEKKGNITYVQPEASYARTHIETLEKTVAELEERVQSIENEFSEIKRALEAINTETPQ